MRLKCNSAWDVQEFVLYLVVNAEYKFVLGCKNIYVYYINGKYKFVPHIYAPRIGRVGSSWGLSAAHFP